MVGLPKSVRMAAPLFYFLSSPTNNCDIYNINHYSFQQMRLSILTKPVALISTKPSTKLPPNWVRDGVNLMFLTNLSIYCTSFRLSGSKIIYNTGASNIFGLNLLSMTCFNIFTCDHMELPQKLIDNQGFHLTRE